MFIKIEVNTPNHPEYCNPNRKGCRYINEDERRCELFNFSDERLTLEIENGIYSRLKECKEAYKQALLD